MGHESPWGLLIVLYLFLAGLSAGAYAVSALGYLLNPSAYRRLARWGAYLAPFPVSVGTALLVLDLGRPWAFYKLFLTLRWTSPMSIGAWLLTLFVGLSLAYAYLWLPRSWQPWPAADAERGIRWLAIAGLPFALGVAVYTGVLLGAGSRPLWSTPLLPQLFMASAFSSGVAAVLAALVLAQSHRPQAEEFRLLVVLDLGLLVLELVILAATVLYSRLGTLSARAAFDVLLTGSYSRAFWLGLLLVGLLLPLGLEWNELQRHHSPGGQSRLPGRPLTLATSALVLIGGLVLRYLMVYAGQQSRWIQ